MRPPQSESTPLSKLVFVQSDFFCAKVKSHKYFFVLLESWLLTHPTYHAVLPRIDPSAKFYGSNTSKFYG